MRTELLSIKSNNSDNQVVITSDLFTFIKTVKAMSNQGLGEWTNVGGAIDMKVYTEELDEPYENIPMNLAAPQVILANSCFSKLTSIY